MRFVHKLLIICGGSFATSVDAQETATRSNGFTISHRHRRQLGDITRLFFSGAEDKHIAFPTPRIVRYEAGDTLPAPVLNQIPNYKTMTAARPDAANHSGIPDGN